MYLDTLFAKREDWKRNAFDNIKRDLVLAKDNRLVRYNSAQEEHLVMVYGKSQVGKTTLILTMMGVREGECFERVSRTLRAGITLGNSSTSTAILYSQSNDDRYGCALTTIDQLPLRDIPAYDEQGMIQKLQEVRSDVENHRARVESLLYITIPKSYFAPRDTNLIDILDMPGVGSRNDKEDRHVQSLMTRYLPISSACTIVCRANNIQALEFLELPGDIDWKRRDHHFSLVLTYAYSSETIKNYFYRDQRSSGTGFYQYVTEVYSKEVRSILGQENRTVIYPLDLSDSMKNLSNEFANEEDKRELLETRDMVLASLQEWIIAHRDDRLKAALDNLRDIVEQVGENAIWKNKQEDERIREEIESLNKGIAAAERRIQLFIGCSEPEVDSESRSQWEEQREDLQRSKDRLQLLHQAQGQFQGRNLYKELELILQQENVQKDRDEVYWKDKNKTKKVRDILRELIVRNTQEWMKRLKEQTDIDISISVRAQEINQRCDVLWEQAPPISNGFLWLKKNRVYIDMLQKVCQTIQSEVDQKLTEALRPHISKLNKEVDEKEKEIKRLENRGNIIQGDIRRYQKKIKEHEESRKKLAMEREKLEDIQRKDRETLEMYLRYAKRAYHKQRDDFIKKINSSSSCPSEKLLMLLFLGVLEKDYIRVTGRSGENGSQ